MCFASSIFGADEIHNKNPLTEQEQTLISEIKKLHQQIQAKRETLLSMLEKDHPKFAARMKERIEEAKKHHAERQNFRVDHKKVE